MRLIDADVLIEHLREYKTVYGVPMTDSDKQVVHCIIGHIKNLEPTAYDVEAKVAELEKTKNECEPMYGGRSCGKEAKAIYAMALSYAISIVRGKE